MWLSTVSTTVTNTVGTIGTGITLLRVHGVLFTHGSKLSLFYVFGRSYLLALYIINE